jgi:hypothetical protein
LPFEESNFARSTRGFFNRDTGEYVAELIFGGEFLAKEYIFRLSVSQQGEFYYAPVIIRNVAATQIFLTIVYENGNMQEFTMRRVRPRQATPKLQA